MLHSSLKRIGPAEFGVHHNETDSPVDLARQDELVYSFTRLEQNHIQ